MNHLQKISILICMITFLLMGCSKNESVDADLLEKITLHDKKLAEIRAINNKIMNNGVHAVHFSITLASITTYDNKKFFFDVSDNEFPNLKEALEQNNTPVPQPVNGVCYAIAISEGADSSSGDDNKLLVGSWIKDQPPNEEKEGAAYVTFEEGNQAIGLSKEDAEKLKKTDFLCENIAKTPRKLLSIVGGKGIGLYIDKEGIKEAFNDFSSNPKDDSGKRVKIKVKN